MKTVLRIVAVLVLLAAEHEGLVGIAKGLCE